MVHGESAAGHPAKDDSENCKRREFGSCDLFSQAISVCDEFCSTLSAQGAVILSHAVKHDHLHLNGVRYLGTSGLGSNDWLLPVTNCRKAEARSFYRQVKGQW
jgi:hypothetical protein